MPITETEIHPFIETGESIPAQRMIVGTFPIYSLTNPRTNRKQELQLQRGDISFFYGSRSNLFWNWYRQYIDLNIDLHDSNCIIESLRTKKIAISDVIKECSRVNESFEDNQLRNKIWNYELSSKINHTINKIICTSKSESGAMGWLGSKILIPDGYTIDTDLSNQLHEQIINNIPGSNINIKSIAQVFSKGNKMVNVVSLPSPGSPERRLIDFGYIKGTVNTEVYLNLYLQTAFNWFMTDTNLM